jgi:hypothetical protein
MIAAAIRRGEFWLASAGADPAGVIAISDDGISEAAVVRRFGGEGVGALLLRWARDRTAAEPDQEARDAFTLTYAPAEHPPSPARGSAVIVLTPDGPVSAVVTDVSADWSMGVVSAGWENGEGGPPPVYPVERDGKTFTATVSQAWADPGAVMRP